MINNVLLCLLIATQIIAESLPVSSSGHVMVLFSLADQFHVTIPQVPDFFDHLLHGPTLLVILIYFFKAWFVPMRFLCKVLLGWMQQRCTFAQLPFSHRALIQVFFKITGMVIAADAVTAACYFIFHEWIKHLAWVQSDYALVTGFVVTGVVLISLVVLRDSTSCFLRTSERRALTLRSEDSWSERLEGLRAPFLRALFLGLIQGLALLPGISRFASTAVVGCWLGMQPRRALQFSFLIFFPLIVAAFFINGLPALLVYGQGLTFVTIPVMVTMMLSTLLAYLLFAFACSLFLQGQWWWFGLYMMVPIVTMMILMLCK